MAKVAKYIALGALFLIPLIPLYIARDLFFPFITGKGFAFRILVEIAVVAWAALMIMDRRYRPQFSWPLVLFGAFTFWIFIADMFAVNAHKALWSNFERMDGFVTLIHVFLFFLVAGSMFTVDKLWRRWWMTFLTVAALVCAYALLQLGGGLTINQGGVRVDGTFGNAIYLAVYLMFATFIAVWQAIESKGWLRYSLIALAVLSVIILFNTASRGAIVAVVAGGALAALLVMLQSGKQGKRLAAGLLVALVLAIGGFMLVKDVPAVIEHPIWGRVASISLSELTVRFTLWDMAGEGIKERPLLGYGQEGYNYIFNGHYRQELYAQEPWFDRAHNAYMDWLVAGGIPALLLFLALIVMTFLALIRSPHFARGERILLIAALAAYALQAIVVFDNLFSYVPLVAILAYVHGKTARPIDRIAKLPEYNSGYAEAIVVPVAGALILFLVLTVNEPNMRAAHHLVYAISPLPGGVSENLSHFRQAIDARGFASQEIAEQLISQAARIVAEPSIPMSVKNEYAALAHETIQAELARAPQDARVQMQASLFYRGIGDNEQALEHIEAASALSPGRQIILLEHAALLIAMDRKQEAITLLTNLYEESPRFRDLTARIAGALITAGAGVEAEAILTEEFGAPIIDHDALVVAYATTNQYGKAIEVLKLQVERRPDSADLRYRLASAYVLAGRVAEARSVIQDTIARFPKSAAQGRAMLEGLPAR